MKKFTKEEEERIAHLEKMFSVNTRLSIRYSLSKVGYYRTTGLNKVHKRLDKIWAELEKIRGYEN